MIALITASLQLEIIAPSFLNMAHSLNVSDVAIGYTITFNVLGACIASLIFGPLSESYGRRKIMIIGTIIFTIGSGMCVVATNIFFLVIARFVQGFGSAAPIVLFSVIVADIYKPEQAGRLYGNLNAVFSGLMAVAPILGSFIVIYFGWRGNLGFVLLLNIISIICLYFFLPETKKELEKHEFNKITSDYRKLSFSKIFLSAAISPSLIYACYIAFISLAPFLYIEHYKLTNFQYVISQCIVISVFSTISVLSGKITNALGIRKSIFVAIVFSLAGSTALFFAFNHYILTISMSFLVSASAISYPIVFARSMEIFPDIKGTASSVIIALRYLAFFAITGAVNYFYDGTSFSLATIAFISAFLGFILNVYLLKNCSLFKEVAID